MSEKLDKVLQQIIRKENIQLPTISFAEEPNHGYFSIVRQVTINDKKTGKELHLFSKLKPNNIIEGYKFCYVNEARFYNQVVPEFLKLTTEQILTLPTVPHCYISSEDYIVMEDLTKSGYALWNPRSRVLDNAHIKAILEAYGKFHAFSFALKHKHPEKFDSFGPKYEIGITNYHYLKKIGHIANMVKTLSDCFDSNTESHYIEAVKELYNSDQVDFLQRLINDDEYDVLIHGDNWVHNYMFQYDSSGQVKHVCMLDFQFYRRSTPIDDLCFFLTMSACSEDVFKSIWDYLKIYHESLEENLLKLNLVTNMYTWEVLKDHWKKYSVRSLFIAAVMTKMIIADKDELDTRRDIDVPMKFAFISRNEEHFRKRMRILVKYFYHAGIMTILDK